MDLWSLLLAAGSAAHAIQPPGRFHGDEPVARNGEPWLALRIDDAGAALIATRVRVSAVRDELLDDEGQATGREVGSPLGNAAVMFLRGDGLTAGPFRSATFSPKEREPAALVHYAIRFGAEAYRMDTECAPAAPVQGQRQFACRLLLAGEGRRQVLLDIAGYSPSGSSDIHLGDDGNLRLLFAGDIDRDGRLDLILDTSTHYNVSRPTLFLSSQAKANELVHEVASHHAVGC